MYIQNSCILLDNIDTVTLVRDITNNEILYANKAAGLFLGVNEKQLIGKNCHEAMKEKLVNCEEIEKELG